MKTEHPKRILDYAAAGRRPHGRFIALWFLYSLPFIVTVPFLPMLEELIGSPAVTALVLVYDGLAKCLARVGLFHGRDIEVWPLLLLNAMTYGLLAAGIHWLLRCMAPQRRRDL